MIVASLLLILVAVVLLVLGLTDGSSGLLVGSIGTSLLAAVALVVGARQAAAARAAAGLLDEDEDEQFDGDEDDEPAGRRAGGRAVVPPRVPERDDWDDEPVRQPVLGRTDTEPVSGYQQTEVVLPAQGAGGRADDFDDEDPPDEPVAQRISPADAARIARMSADVLVIDGRPRYHVAGCVHLLGRPCEPLPVSEAVDLGFSPCGLCEPDSALLADARRV
ncbi:hypothetical protein Cme02nite_12830 [Catellatospora methionotrophica]|uniref:Uncharacterized protein n=1 Tax=Catellatospora methionotrophica TaxID=121620 RepID=A0A8J3LD86_9ACTN|nr:hypothetical protein [Catellatospora methionotrophica]GIG12951.1 hypothetical protein Cme02nite_12830 [Catellatospora methionotrophica]